MNNVLLYILFYLHAIPIFASSNYPADISYLVCDLKYSQKYGLKICEVQHGSLSALTGDLYLTGGDGTIAPKVAQFFTQFATQKWATELLYQPLQKSFTAQGWKIKKSFHAIEQDQTFLLSAKLQTINPCAIACYTGIVYADFDIGRNFSYYSKKYPGILFMNAATFPYWNDKYKMNILFNEHNELKQYKADWQVYPKKYEPYLAKKIQQEMPSEMYVIKPTNSSLAHGVIVVQVQELDTVLQMILEPLPSLEKHPDKKYTYWSKNKDEHFLIEKYYESDYVYLDTKNHYDPTMRIVCILQSDQGNISYHSLGGFWKLPCKALEEQGTLNEKRISCCKPPFYKAVDQDLLKEVNVHMEKAMILLYEVMLQQYHKQK